MLSCLILYVLISFVFERIHPTQNSHPSGSRALTGFKMLYLPHQLQSNTKRRACELCRTWPALALALHFNIHHQLYAPLFTNYMGMGDKDSYVMAILAMHLPYSMVQHSASALGFATRKCSWISCSDTMSTNSIMQHAPDGTMMFLHANMPPKWYLAVAADWEAQQRRWTVISPGPDTLLQSFKEAIDHHLGCDYLAVTPALHSMCLKPFYTTMFERCASHSPSWRLHHVFTAQCHQEQCVDQCS